MPKILDQVNTPADVKALSLEELTRLAEEIRDLIIQTVSRTGGHLAANLGTVELTLALLKVFDPPTDKLIWDVSHQAYTYKILTGRKDKFATLRQIDGLSGFLTRAESPCDAWGAGHAGTAISAALGMAVARDRRQGQEHIVAIVGDGALGCGSSFEALNNVAAATRQLIVILNDNKMSISANVGATAQYLGKLLAHPRYNRWKSSVERFARSRLGWHWLRRLYLRTEEAVKSLFLPNVLFEEFGLRYIGPIDGHNFRTLLAALAIARSSDEPILLHVTTQKGKGYPFAEEEPDVWHGTGAFECQTGKPLKAASTLKYADVFGQTLERLAAQDDRLVAITAAMAVGTGLARFAERFPQRFFDVGICEEHAVIFAAGLAAEGLRPVVAVYSTFSQRVVDYVIHDVCLQKLPVIFGLDRAGLVGDDGPTHHGIFDIPLFRAIPNLTLIQPRNEAELAHLLYSATRWNRPVMIRYPRGGGPGVPVPDRLEELPYGQAEVLREGREIQLWALGDLVPLAERVAERLTQRGLQPGLVNPRFISPLDTNLLQQQCAAARVIVTLENGVLPGGFGSAISEWLTAAQYGGKILRFGWPAEFIPQGSLPTMCERYGLTEHRITEAILKAV